MNFVDQLPNSKNENYETLEDNFSKEKKELQKISGEILDTQLIAQEHKFFVRDLKTEIESTQHHREELEDHILDLFPDLDSDELEGCLEEIEKLHIFFGPHIKPEQIQKIILQIKEQKENTNPDDENSQNLQEDLHKAILEQNLEIFKNPISQLISEQTNFFANLVYLQNQQDELDEKQKKLLAQRFEAFEAWIMEGHALEIYEIQIVNGQIIIKGVHNGKLITINYNLKTNKFENIFGLEIKVPQSIQEKIHKKVQNFKTQTKTTIF